MWLDGLVAYASAVQTVIDTAPAWGLLVCAAAGLVWALRCPSRPDPCRRRPDMSPDVPAPCPDTADRGRDEGAR